MIRCDPNAALGRVPRPPVRPTRRRAAALAAAASAALLLGAAAPQASAQMARPFPANALRGTLTVVAPPLVDIDGREARLAPGARIRGQDNLIVPSGQLAGSPRLVHYTLDAAGNVHAVWILRPDEAAVRPWPSTPEQAARWAFDPASQTWTRSWPW